MLLVFVFMLPGGLRAILRARLPRGERSTRERIFQITAGVIAHVDLKSMCSNVCVDLDAC